MQRQHSKKWFSMLQISRQSRIKDNPPQGIQNTTVDYKPKQKHNTHNTMILQLFSLSCFFWFFCFGQDIPLPPDGQATRLLKPPAFASAVERVVEAAGAMTTRRRPRRRPLASNGSKERIRVWIQMIVFFSLCWYMVFKWSLSKCVLFLCFFQLF